MERLLAGVRKDFADWQKGRIAGPAEERAHAELSEPSPPDEPNLSLAAKVFELLTALDPDNRLRKAPPIKVFNLYYRQRLGPLKLPASATATGRWFMTGSPPFERRSPGRPRAASRNVTARRSHATSS